MSVLSEHARCILDRLEGDRCYDVHDLRAFLTDASVERLREVMHELWINRQVERVGHSGWRRHRSTPALERPAAGRTAKAVKPEELFDHDTFEEFFR
jgi:hypothetical protein